MSTIDLTSNQPTIDLTGDQPATGRRRRAADLSLIRIVAGREISQQLRNKTFWISVTVTSLMLCLSFTLTGVLRGSSADRPAVAVVGAQPALAAALASQTEVRDYADAGAAQAAVRAGKADAALLPGGQVAVLRTLPSGLAQSIQHAYQTTRQAQQLTALGATRAEVDQALAPEPLRITTLDKDAARTQERTMTAGLGVFLLFILMMISGLGIAQGVAEEKSSRIVEVLLAKVRAWHLLAGKIVGLGTAALVQILLLVTAALTAAIASGAVEAPLDTIGAAVNVLIWFVPGYLLFVTMYAAAGALVSRPEDVNRVIGPVNMLQMISLVGPALAVSGKHQSLIEALSLVPGVSWAAMPVRMAVGPVPWWQVGASFALMLAAVAALLRIGSRIYTGGLLQHGGIVKVRDALRGARR
ncbi:ABC-2 type transport system permease protein [Streptomyces puniciscabiei]|uniref:ABC-2 type transport system permease protein n=1 Tax=Streptomyces puniciscabiei TaxID=164348 RepID=A0A542UH82_9ACTN|nr:ABC transporter permease [Streptomyces puniciscabiei]TQK98422.1 ABC-2 type transport system permease protein [Streptomyces puniciscabiei]